MIIAVIRAISGKSRLPAKSIARIPRKRDDQCSELTMLSSRFMAQLSRNAALMLRVDHEQGGALEVVPQDLVELRAQLENVDGVAHVF